MDTQFDNLANSYDEELKGSLGKFGGKNVNVFAEYKIKTVKSKLRKTPANILEFGCGTGRNNTFMKMWFPESRIYGCDISEKSLEIAAGINPAVQYDKIANTNDMLRVYKEPFDCIFISNVFHHIPFHEHNAWLSALYGILSDDGTIFIFEHNPHNPLTRHIFNNSAIDVGAAMLNPSYCFGLLRDAGFTGIKREYALFFLWRNGFFETIERTLRWLPLGAQYVIWGKKNHAYC
jgi:SAM-dependent methyltransferase